MAIGFRLMLHHMEGMWQKNIHSVCQIASTMFLFSFRSHQTDATRWQLKPWLSLDGCKYWLSISRLFAKRTHNTEKQETPRMSTNAAFYSVGDNRSSPTFYVTQLLLKTSNSLLELAFALGVYKETYLYSDLLHV